VQKLALRNVLARPALLPLSPSESRVAPRRHTVAIFGPDRLSATQRKRCESRLATNITLLIESQQIVIYSALSLLQKWSVNLNEKDLDQILKLKASITGWLKAFKPS
jgi:hypothetical protein